MRNLIPPWPYQQVNQNMKIKIKIGIKSIQTETGPNPLVVGTASWFSPNKATPDIEPIGEPLRRNHLGESWPLVQYCLSAPLVCKRICIIVEVL